MDWKYAPYELAEADSKRTCPACGKPMTYRGIAVCGNGAEEHEWTWYEHIWECQHRGEIIEYIEDADVPPAV